MPETTTAGAYSPGKKLLSGLIYGLFFLSLPFGGERYYVLCRPVR